MDSGFRSQEGHSQHFRFAPFIPISSERLGWENLQKADQSGFVSNSLPQSSCQHCQGVSDPASSACWVSSLPSVCFFIPRIYILSLVASFVHWHDDRTLCTERCFLMGSKCKLCLLRFLFLFLAQRTCSPYDEPQCRGQRPKFSLVINELYVAGQTLYRWALVFIICKTEIEKLWNFRAERYSRGQLVQELQI